MLAQERPAFRRFAGKSVLAHQIDCAAHLGCTRVLCLASGRGPDLGVAKTYAEAAGLRFDAAPSLAALTAQITADDEILLIADGVLPDRAALVEALSARAGVLAFPEDPGLALGFERLDATRAWSGALRTRGDSVARLADLPVDCDLDSSLLRVALQMGTRVIELDPAPLAEGSWQRRADRRTNAEAEWRWISRQVRPAPFLAPGRAVMERVGLRLSREAGGGRWARAPHAATFVSGAIALLAALVHWPVAGLIALLGAQAALAIATVCDRVERIGARPRSAGRALIAAGWLCDALLVALLSMLVITVPGWLGVVIPVVLVGLLHLGAAGAAPRARALFTDRIVLLAVLAPLAYLGWTTVAVGALILGVLAALLWLARPAPQDRLTAD